QLQNAGQQLAKANQNLQKGQPNQAGQKQAQAAKELANALKAMNAAAKGMKQPGDAQAKADGQPGDDGDDGMGDDGMGKDGQGELIRQALSAQLPPEYAAVIQQYYINIARGRAVPGAAPAVPSNNK